jgi:hypothetical protein
MNTPLVNKLLTLALDRAAMEPEAVAAFLKLRQSLLASGETVADFRREIGEARTVIRTVSEPRVPWSPALTFGKHKGYTVRDVAATEAGRRYLAWVYAKCERVNYVIREAIADELRFR